MFIDECSAYVGLTFNYGRAPSDQRVFDRRPKGKDKKKRASLIAAISLDKSNSMAAQSLVVEGTVDRNAFLGYLEFVLLPILKKGTVIVMDNWTVHHGEEIRDLVQEFGCELLYLPTYSPDLNPIEHLFAKVKAVIKKAKPDSIPQLIQSFCDAVLSVSYQHILNSVRHCGYNVVEGL